MDVIQSSFLILNRYVFIVHLRSYNNAEAIIETFSIS